MTRNKKTDAVPWSDLAAFALCAVVFLIPYLSLARRVIHTPAELQAGLAAWGLLTGDARFAGFSPSLPLLGRAVPVLWLAERPINGPLGIYTLLPFLAGWGLTQTAITARNGVFAVLAIGLAYLLGSRLNEGSRPRALAGALLFAACPGFQTEAVFGLARGVSVVAWTLASLLCALRYAERRRPAPAFAAAFFAGLALCDQPWALGLVAGLLACAALFGLERRLWPGCLAAFLLPLLPVLAFNAFGGWATARYFAAHAFVSADGVRNLEIGGNLLRRARDFLGLLDGNASWTGLLVSRPERFALGRPWAWAAAGAVLAAFGAARAGRRSPSKRWLALFLAAAVYFLLSIFTPTDFASHHLLPLVPLAAIAAAAFARGPRGAALSLGLAFLLAAGSWRAARRIGAELDGAGAAFPGFSTATQDLADWAVRRGGGDWLVFFPQLRASLTYCSRGAVFFHDAPPDLGAEPDGWFSDRGRFFVFASPEELPRFDEELRRRGLAAVPVAVFPKRDGGPAYEVYQARPAAPASKARRRLSSSLNRNRAAAADSSA